MALAGRKGHLAIVDMKTLNLFREFQVRETVRDVVFLHNELFFAAAQKKQNSQHVDLRKFEVIQTLHGHAKTLDFSQKGLLACASGSVIQIHGDLSGSHKNLSRYMTHSMAKGYQTQKVVFRPYGDVLAIGHSAGWSSILIP
ncbi:unnamed protein product, partial [Cuscuta epithymum]